MHRYIPGAACWWLTAPKPHGHRDRLPPPMTKPPLASANLPVLGRDGEAQVVPSGERTMVAGHTTARLRVVSKCALSREPIKEK